MRLERVTALRQLKTGDSVWCRIEGDDVTDCKVSVERKGRKITGVFLCQDDHYGRECNDLQGYDTSWIVYDNDCHPSLSEGLAANEVTGLRKIVKENHET